MPTPLSREDRAWLVSFIVLAGFVLAVFFHYYLGVYKGLPYPRNTFLIDPTDARMDFYNTFHVFRAGTPYANPHIAYFPFAGVPFYLLNFLPARLVLMLMLAGFVATVVGLLYSALKFLPGYERVTATAILSFLSYPFLFSIDRANIECLLFALLCLFFVAYRRDYLKISVVFLACATAMKLYPGVFVVLFLARKQYKAALGVIALTSLLTVAGAAVFPGEFRVRSTV
jgi:hypothetical protein